MLHVGKLDAANRQLDYAIDLFFRDGDEVCIHTLVGAASMLLTDLLEVHAPERSWDRHAQTANALSPSQYFNVVRNAQNFLKHAREYPSAILDFDQVQTEELMMLAVMNSGELQDLSIPQSVYQLWYLGARAHALGPEFPFISEALELFPELANSTRSHQRLIGLRVLEDAVSSNGLVKSQPKQL